MEDSSIDTDEAKTVIPKFCLSHEEIQIMQKNNAIRDLRLKIKNNIPRDKWRSGYLKQFSRSCKHFEIVDNVLVRNNLGNYAIVFFPFLVEIVYKVHNQLAHIGQHKLVKYVSEWFWHLALEKVARDLCASCHRCELFKVHNQPIRPPVIKIKTAQPFDLLAVNLLLFPHSARGNVAVLVCVDHFKFLSAIPIQNKRAETVANALQNKVLPFLPLVPGHILSDNGPEFSSQEFEKMLRENCIEN